MIGPFLSVSVALSCFGMIFVAFGVIVFCLRLDSVRTYSNCEDFALFLPSYLSFVFPESFIRRVLFLYLYTCLYLSGIFYLTCFVFDALCLAVAFSCLGRLFFSSLALPCLVLPVPCCVFGFRFRCLLLRRGMKSIACYALLFVLEICPCL